MAEKTVPDGVPVPGTETGTNTRRHVRDKTYHVIVTLVWTNMNGDQCMNTWSTSFQVPGTQVVHRREAFPELVERACVALHAPSGAPVLFYSLERDEV